MLKKWFNISKEFKRETGEDLTVSTAGPMKSMRANMRSLIDGSFFGRANFVKNIFFVLYLTVLGLIYIGNNYKVDALVRRETALQKQNARLRSRQVVITFRLLKETQLSKVQETVDTNGMGLKILTRPPYVIEIDKN